MPLRSIDAFAFLSLETHSTGKGAYLEGEYGQAKQFYRRAIVLKPDTAAGYLVSCAEPYSLSLSSLS